MLAYCTGTKRSVFISGFGIRNCCVDTAGGKYFREDNLPDFSLRHEGQIKATEIVIRETKMEKNSLKPC